MKNILPVGILLVTAVGFLAACSGFQANSTGNPPTIISRNVVMTKNQQDHEHSSDFRKRFGKKIFDYEHAKPDFSPPRLPRHGSPHPISGLPPEVLSPSERTRLSRAGITGYSIYWEDYWWGRTYWFCLYYRNGNSFSYDVFTKAKKNAIIICH